MTTAPGFVADTPASLRQEVEALHDVAWGWALACCGRDAELATDVLQDSHAKVLNGDANFDHRASFKMGVSIGTARRHYHRGKKNLLSCLAREGVSRDE